jgi:hypothetical protein
MADEKGEHPIEGGLAESTATAEYNRLAVLEFPRPGL